MQTERTRTKPTLEKLLARCIPEPNSGCLLWEGPLNYKGYGVANDGTNVRLVHRPVVIPGAPDGPWRDEGGGKWSIPAEYVTESTEVILRHRLAAA